MFIILLTRASLSNLLVKYAKDYMTSIKQILSVPRFEGYRQSPTEADLECLKRYVWNVAISESLYPIIQFLEIALRNSIHNAATNAFGTDFWFDNPTIIRNPKTLTIISQAKGHLTSAHKPIESGRVIAELHFGFWRALFFNEYERKLWTHIVKKVFPNAPKSSRKRSVLSSRIDRAHSLRNRISHHEPVWNWPDLVSRHDEILETIGWINEPLQDLVKISDRFGAAYNMDTNALETRLKALRI